MDFYSPGNGHQFVRVATAAVVISVWVLARYSRKLAGAKGAQMLDLKSDTVSAVGSLVAGGVIKTAAVFGALGGVWAFYSNSGLPVPATLSQVESKIAAVVDRIGGLERRMDLRMKGFEITNLEGQRNSIRSSRIPLINERFALESTIPNAPDSVKQSLRRRFEEIGIQLDDLAESDATIKRRIDELQGARSDDTRGKTGG